MLDVGIPIHRAVPLSAVAVAPCPERPTECRMPKARQRSEASSPDRRNNGESPATAAARPAGEARDGEPTAAGRDAVGSKTLRSDVLVPAREVGREGSAVLMWWD